MKGKMWDARFSKAVDSRVNDFNSSISFDWRMYKSDITGSIAHATMLGECGIIAKEESAKIIEALRQILADIESGALAIDPEAEDIHMFIEAVLTERIGETGKRLHTARSRNDQVALDIRMHLKEEIKAVQTLIASLLDAICSKAEEHVDTVMPGYTHLQRAQPVTFAHYILAYAQMFMRDYERLCDVYKRTDVMPLGSGALASTTYPIDRHMVADLLGFSTVTENSMDGVSDRDFVLELGSALSILMMHMSRFSEEIILWCSSEFKFIELDDAYSTGSSIMPQKKNPDVAELVRGKTGRVYGDLTTLLTMMKGIPLAYNKDMQEDKEAIFDALDNVKIAVEVFTAMFTTMTVRKDNMRAAASRGFINATDCADYLVKKGMAFRDAYKISGRLVAHCIAENTTLEDLPLDTYKSYSDLFGEDVYGAISLETCVAERGAYGGPAPASVRRQITLLRSFLSEAK
ncbi:MAG: argininosuccinate lyase [Clostridia bacterium]|nr:argininosuccinate lyase [Clostridia bacterium]